METPSEDRTVTTRKKWTSALVLGLALGGSGNLTPAAAEAPTRAAVEAPKAQVQAEFDDAYGHLKKLMGDLTVMQAQYQQPKVDKAALEAKFNQVKAVAQVAGDRLEAAAVNLLAVDPKNDGARQITMAVLAGSLESDDPGKALQVADAIAASGAVTPDVAMIAASAAMLLSDLDGAEAWLAKAKAAKAPAETVAEIEQTMAGERPKLAAEMSKRKAEAAADDLPRIRIDTTAGPMVVELFENEAPNAVANFVSLVEKGFYDGTPFHRVIPGFMAQGGDPTGTGTGGPGYQIACECENPEARKHFRGTLSMAHAGKDTGGSQFFLTFKPTEHLDGKHTVFGRVIEGDAVLAKLARTQDSQGQPVPGVQPDRIKKAEVVRKRNHPYVPKTSSAPR